MFRKEIDTSDREAMLCFLEEHPKYHLYNSWNLVRGFSQCIKIHTLDVDDKTKNKFYDMLSLDDNFEIQMIFSDVFDDFRNNNPGYAIYTNGASGGYLALHADNNQIYQDQLNCLDDLEDSELRELTNTVINFDKAADTLIEFLSELASETEVIETEILVPKKIHVLKRIDED
jgi:hypothetical protein